MSKNAYADLISTTEQAYVLTQSQKPTKTELLKALHSSWLLSPSSNKSGNDDVRGDDGEPADVALATPGAFATSFNKECFKCGVNRQLQLSVLRQLTTTTAIPTVAEEAKQAKKGWIQR